MRPPGRRPGWRLSRPPPGRRGRASASRPTIRSVPKLLRRGLFGDRHHSYRQLRDVEVPDPLVETLRDPDLDLHAKRQLAENPDLVGTREQIVHRLPHGLLGYGVEQVVVEKHERADRHHSGVEHELLDVVAPIEVAIRHGRIDKLFGMAQRVLGLVQRARLRRWLEDSLEDLVGSRPRDDLHETDLSYQRCPKTTLRAGWPLLRAPAAASEAPLRSFSPRAAPAWCSPAASRKTLRRRPPRSTPGRPAAPFQSPPTRAGRMTWRVSSTRPWSASRRSTSWSTTPPPIPISAPSSTPSWAPGTRPSK